MITISQNTKEYIRLNQANIQTICLLSLEYSHNYKSIIPFGATILFNKYDDTYNNINLDNFEITTMPRDASMHGQFFISILLVDNLFIDLL